MLSALPDPSLVQFQANKLTNARVLWINAQIGAKLDFEAYSYCIPHEGDVPSVYSAETRTFFGERYGGKGVGGNGGGVRCGSLGGVQVKGIGRNPLAGQYSDFKRTHGGANVAEAVREAIWGEICHKVLPYGGVRTLGILATGSNTYGVSGTTLDQPRALIIRQWALRPAHYMRAVNFVPTGAFLEANGSDTKRTRAAIALIGQHLSAIYGEGSAKSHSVHHINACLAAMAQRFATQIAASRVKRIPHGAVNCSNICLDGRYVDYGTQSAISDYGRVILARGNPDLWSEHQTLIQTFNDLLFYLRNYLPAGGAAVMKSTELTEIYRRHFAMRLAVEFVKLTGVPESDIMMMMRAPETKLLYASMTKLYLAGNEEPFKLSRDCPVRMGTYHLNSITSAAAWCKTAAEADTALSDLIDDAALRQSFARSFVAVRETYIQRQPVHARQAARVFMSFNCMRLNSSLSPLYRFNLDQDAANLASDVNSAALITDFINERTAAAAALLSEPTDKTISLAWVAGTELNLSANGRLTQHGKQVDKQMLKGLVAGQMLPLQATDMIKGICG